MSHVPFGATRGFSVPAGPHTINLVCEEAFGDTAIGGPEVTAIFWVAYRTVSSHHHAPAVIIGGPAVRLLR
jgi:hypothetical protein